MTRATLILGLSLTVLAVDGITKAVAPADSWMWHRDAFATGPPGWAHLPLILAGLVCAAAFRSFGFAVATAGVVGNVVWQVGTGGVPNMIVTVEDGQPVAYNVADAAIQAGAIMGAAELAVVVAGAAVAYRARSGQERPVPKATAPGR